MRRLPALHRSIALLLLAATWLLGCEENLSPRDHYDKPFSVYGTLSPDLDTQSVRVYTIEDFPTLGSDSIDAVVASKDLATGETRTWEDSVVVDPNGQYEHVFWCPFTAEYGHTYHVEVTRPSDGATSSADVRVPAPATVRITNPDDPHLMVLIEGKGIRALTPEVEYVAGGGSMGTIPRISYTISYAGKEKQVEQGWEVDVNLVIDHYWVDRWYQYDLYFGNFLRSGNSRGLHLPDFEARTADVKCPSTALHDMILHVIVGDSVWNPPSGIFDPKILAQPGVLGNVENGFGFVGGGYRISQPLRPSRQAVEQACFYYAW